MAKANGELLPTHPDFYRTPSIRKRLTRKAVQSRIYGKDDEDYVGFATLPDQVHRKAVKRGFDFTIMVVGETGLGKSTLMNSLFLADLYKDRTVERAEERIHQTVKIEKKSLEIEEKGVKLRLTVVDTPGFNDAVNGHECWKPIIDYMDGQFEQYFLDETGLNRKNIQDNRVHCCIYFISPYGHGLRQIDIEMMRQLHTRVNIVPVIAKADCLTHTEIRKLKAKILDEIEEHGIRIYEFPDCDSDEDEDFKQQDKELKKCIPFSVVGCNSIVEVNGKRIRGRVYPWGIVEVDNPKHCDFGQLQQMLISTHMQDLKDVTVDVHYEAYRERHIAAQMNNNHRERNKLKRESTTNFEAIADTEKLLAQKDAEIQRMQVMLAQMEVKLESPSKPSPNGRPSQPPPHHPQGVMNGVRRY